MTLGYLGKGSIDGYCIEFLKPWDIAAGALIVREAGGVIMDISGGEYDIMKPNIIAAGTQKVADEIKKILGEVQTKLETDGNSPKQLLEKMNK